MFFFPMVIVLNMVDFQNDEVSILDVIEIKHFAAQP